MFGGVSPSGLTPTTNFFDYYPSRRPLLGSLTSLEATVVAELRAADAALSFFDVLFYDGSALCGHPDPNLAWCLNTALAFMLNSSSAWKGIERLRFFITYSNDIDAGTPNVFVGAAGEAKWISLVGTWVGAMGHDRYLKVNGRPIFKVLIPTVFVQECGGNSTLATLRLHQLRAAAAAAGVGAVAIGGGWANPAVGGQGGTLRPHPEGYMRYNNTKVTCPGSCILKAVPVSSVTECLRLCNETSACVAVDADHKLSSCKVLSSAGPAAGDPANDVYVRVNPPVEYDWTGTYNDAPPPNSGGRYTNSWMPNSTQSGAKVFPYKECGDFQGEARTNHSNDSVPYLPNIIAGFDPRPWEEHAPSFAFPSSSEWEAVLRQVKEQALSPANNYGFPDASKPRGVQPAVNIYAWNEYLT